MQPTGGSSGEHSRGNLQRFASAPATWLEALLESDMESNNIILEPAPVATSSFSPRKVGAVLPPHPPPPRTPPSCGISRQPSGDLSFLDAGGGEGSGVGISGFLRQSSSPAEFLSVVNSEGYFSGFGGPGNMEYLLNSTGAGAALGNKRARQGDFGTSTPKLSSAPMKVEQSTELQGDIVGLLDAEMDKLTEDAVLCRVRAKRGCATHPRSIAERVRRTRISDRIRKLQELVPNMDKQTNTADMLDEAVEYVKFLQKQIQELTEHQKRCICSMKE